MIKSTRYYSNKQEEEISKKLKAYKQPNSGATPFRKGDLLQKQASLLIECKTVMKSKDSISIKKEWVKKNKDEAYTQRVSYGCIAFNFEPDGENYYIIDEKLMKFLVEKLCEEN